MAAITKAPGGGEVAGRSPVDRGKQGLKRSGMTDGYGIPLGRVLAGANRHDSSLLAPTLDRLDDLGPLPDGITVHLDVGYDSDKTRALLSERGLHAAASHTKARKRPSRPVGVGMSNAPTPGRTPSTGSPAATSGAPRSSTHSSTSPTPSSPSAA
ncbi:MULTISPECIES: transposase [unclassified Streptomyces]|uniref:transposase n=1 Tax=unclassified Streptomyces TaxID=2593676 RepID=UPI003369F155